MTSLVSKLFASGALSGADDADLLVCNPLGVATNSVEKHRLIVDLRYVNKHLRSCKFKYEDIRCAADLFQQGDWLFKFDYTSRYHHVEFFCLSILNSLTALGGLLVAKSFSSLRFFLLVCQLVLMSSQKSKKP